MTNIIIKEKDTNLRFIISIYHLIPNVPTFYKHNLPVSSTLFSVYHLFINKSSPIIIQPSLCILYSFLPISSNLLPASSTLFSLYPLFSSSCILYFFLPISSNLLPVSFTLFSQYHPTFSLYPLFFSSNIIQPVPLYPILFSPCILYSLLFVSSTLFSLYPLFINHINQPFPIILYNSFLPISSNLLPISSTLFSQYHPTFSLYSLLFSPNIIQPSPCILYSFLPISSNLLPVFSTLFSHYHPTFSLYPLLFSHNIIQSLPISSTLFSQYHPTFSSCILYSLLSVSWLLFRSLLPVFSTPFSLYLQYHGYSQKLSLFSLYPLLQIGPCILVTIFSLHPLLPSPGYAFFYNIYISSNLNPCIISCLFPSFNKLFSIFKCTQVVFSVCMQ